MAKFNRITQVQPSVFRKQFHAKNFAVVESGLKAAANSPLVLDRHNFKPVHPPPLPDHAGSIPELRCMKSHSLELLRDSETPFLIMILLSRVELFMNLGQNLKHIFLGHLLLINCEQFIFLL